MYVAVKTFRDPSDGRLVKAGVTYVAEEAELFRTHRRFFKLAKGESRGPITRLHLGSSAILARSETATRRPSSRPYWQLGRGDYDRPAWRLR
jgi:hypothetical protein